MGWRRLNLLEIFQAALASVNGEPAVKNWLTNHIVAHKKIVLIAVGKAAPAMASGALAILGDQIKSALVISKYGHFEGFSFPDKFQCLEAAHPYPDENSLAAGQAMIEKIAALSDDEMLLMLISGGTSALVEVLPEGMTLADLDKLNHWLLAGGLDIVQVNKIRKTVSCIKGGRLCAYFRGQQVLSLLISDVPGDDPASIGSGLLTKPVTVMESEPAESELPEWLRNLQQQAQASIAREEFADIELQQFIIASNRLACLRAADKAIELGFESDYHDAENPGGQEGELHDNAETTAQHIVEYLKTAPAGIHIWGGETTVVLPDNPGRGGRNQHLALAAAIALQGREDIFLLAAGTDGTDGPTADAGALVDGQTVQRGEEQGFQAQDSLQRAGAGHFLQASGDLIHTGPTGTNVMDLVIALKIEKTE